MLIPLNNSRRLVCFLLTVGLASLTAHAQTSQAERERKIEEVRQQQSLDNRMRNLRRLDDRLQGNRANSSRTVKLSAEQKKLLEPSQAHKAAFADFLRQPDTGLVRLLPREKYADTTVMPLRGGGAFYSFTESSHEPSRFSEIAFQGGNFRVGLTGMTYALMTEQRETPLEQLTIDNQAVRFLHDLVPPLSYRDFTREMDKNTAGFEVEGSLYKTFLPMHLNSTYVLRSTLYNSADTVIAFRVVGLDANGSVTLLWKRLYKLPSKKLKGNSH